MNHILADFIADGTKSRKDRVECFKYFGTFTKSMLSMFQVTFGDWVPICRFLHEKVDERFALFFVCYQFGMGVAVLRIVYGVFLHVTFRCAHTDEDLMIAQESRAQQKFATQIRDVFNEFDTSGEGYLSRDEFQDIGKDLRVKTLLLAMGLDVNHADLVFQLFCADGQDELTADEMVLGFSQLKGTARSVAVAELLGREKKSSHKLDQLVNLTFHIAAQMADMSGKCDKPGTQHLLEYELSGTGSTV